MIDRTKGEERNNVTFFSNGNSSFHYPYLVLLLSKWFSEYLIKKSKKDLIRSEACLYLSFFGNIKRIDITNSDDVISKIIYSIAIRSKKDLKKYRESYEEKLKNLIEEYKVNKKRSILEKIEELINDSIFAHLVSLETLGTPIFVNKYFEKIIDDFSEETKAVLFSFKYLDEKYSIEKKDVYRLVNSLSSEFTIKSINMLILSYKLAIKYEKYKRDFMILHYSIIKSFSKYLGSTNLLIKWKFLDDLFIDLMLKFSIALYICGYFNSLCLPNSERIAYLQKVISEPSIILEFNRAYKKYATFDIIEQINNFIHSFGVAIEIKGISLKIEIWKALLIDFILISISGLINGCVLLGRCSANQMLPILFILSLLSIVFTIPLIFILHKLDEKIRKELE